MKFLKILLILLTIFCTLPDLAQAGKVSQIEVYKSRRLMVLWDKFGKPVRTYKIALGKSPRGHKKKQGDKKTPEGWYYIEGRNPDSAYHLSLKISYPNDSDWNEAVRRGEEPGSMIMIHGLPNGHGAIGKRHLQKDWTDGCIAVTNKEIQEIWQLVDDGTPIKINP